MKLIYTTKQKRRFVQIKHKWCNKLNRDNLKFKLYTTYNLYEKTPLPSLYNTFFISLKTRTLIILKL
jgi:hypothetical protein